MKNKNILTQAIEKLPLQRAPEKVWVNIEHELDKEQGLQHLDSAITYYTSKKLQATLPWERIEQELDSQQKLSNAIQSLPEHKLNKDLFEAIIESEQKQGSKKHIHLLYWISGIAASILIAIAFLWPVNPWVNAQKIQVSYSEEIISETDWQRVYSQFSEEDEVLQFIRENCNQLAIQCQTPKFQGLLKHYIELDTVRQELVTQIQTHREQTQLAIYLIRIEKEKTEVGKKLIQHLLL